ncbi:olfactory receptor 5G9-like [Pelobates fuscus]|uniref:olfactory receptor 5G9-like n=1 Tax=Pelobates fuscus TaxID=191477 RepID=UPI002FE498A9
MLLTNQTENLEFQFLGFSFLVTSPIFSFLFFLVIYIFNISGNTVIIIITRLDAYLQKPMYFFLGNLSLVDISFTTTTLPKLLNTILAQEKTISFVGCIMQMYFFLAVGVTESFLLAVMSYDRYVAICNPLRYTMVMKQEACTFMVLGCWMIGLLSVLPPVVIISKLPFCQSHVINHFFCDISPVIQLSCSDVHNLEMFIFFTAAMVILGTFSVIVISYVHILRSILSITTQTGKKKAFSTCASHLTSVLIYFGTIIFMYIRPKSKSNLDLDKTTSVFYSIVTPTLNPLIYSFRNNEMKSALRRTVLKQIIVQKF